jgi:hydroxymethylpyrimidine/phosphomethylpyrimidine kinase
MAGSDSGGGAGIQADLKTFYGLGAHGVFALTSITAQNTRAVLDTFDLDPWLVISQLEAIFSDFKVAGAKTGMLGNAYIVKGIAGILASNAIPNLVVDPVFASSTHRPLLDEDGIASLIEHLLPLADVLTPNLSEAERIAGNDVHTLEDMKQAALALREMGPAAVVVTGGHLAREEAVDVFYDGRRMLELAAPRIRSGNDHGTGCVFSAAIAARLAFGQEVLQAVRAAKEDVKAALENSIEVGRGRGVVQPVCRVRPL